MGSNKNKRKRLGTKQPLAESKTKILKSLPPTLPHPFHLILALSVHVPDLVVNWAVNHFEPNVMLLLSHHPGILEFLVRKGVPCALLTRAPMSLTHLNSLASRAFIFEYFRSSTVSYKRDITEAACVQGCAFLLLCMLVDSKVDVSIQSRSFMEKAVNSPACVLRLLWWKGLKGKRVYLPPNVVEQYFKNNNLDAHILEHILERNVRLPVDLLRRAANENNPKVFEMLLDSGKFVLSESVLHLVCLPNRANILKIILARDFFDPNCAPLTYLYKDALKWVNPSVVKVFLDDGRFDPNLIYLAPAKHRVHWGKDIANLVLQHPRCNLTSLKEILGQSCHYGWKDMFNELLQIETLSVSLDGNRALKEAVRHGRLDMAKMLIGHPRFLPIDLESILTEVASDNHYESVKLLLECFPTLPTNKTLELANGPAHSKIIRLLLSSPQTIASKISPYVLSRACQSGDEDLVRLLIEKKKIDPSPKDNLALRDSAASFQWGIVKYLISLPNVDPAVDRNYLLRVLLDQNQDELVRQVLRHPKIKRRFKI